MQRLIKMPSIKQYNQVVRDVKWAAQYQGFDELTNQPVLDRTAKMPIISCNISEKIHGCLKFDTLITTKEYGDIPIKEIVDNKLSCHVLTKNLKTGKKEWNLVKNFWKSKNNKHKKWLKITLEDNTELFLTEDHKIYNPETDDYQEAKNFNIGDFIEKR